MQDFIYLALFFPSKNSINQSARSMSGKAMIFTCVFQLKYGAFYLSKATVDLAV